MLPARSRLRDKATLTATVRRGTRSGRRCLVVHFLAAETSGQSVELVPPRVGFAVSKAVGGSVVRHQVSRRLRHVVAAHLGELPAGSTIVVRALAPAASASSADLDRDFTSALSRVA